MGFATTTACFLLACLWLCVTGLALMEYMVSFGAVWSEISYRKLRFSRYLLFISNSLEVLTIYFFSLQRKSS